MECKGKEITLKQKRKNRKNIVKKSLLPQNFRFQV